MPAPVAKGIIIGVSVIVAAGIAVYESPQFQRWVQNSRRKIALALYNLGDEISPSESSSVLQDISMTEDPGEAAAERRNKAREELLRRREFMETRRRTQSSSSSSSTTAVSFDSLVDREGRLRSEAAERDNEAVNTASSSTAQSTAVEKADETEMVQRRAVQSSSSLSSSEPLTEGRLQAQRELMEAMEQDRLRLAMPASEASSHHPSESLVDLTPTSEFPDTDLGASAVSSARGGQMNQSEYFSITSVPEAQNEAETRPSEYYYAHPSEPSVHSPEPSHPEDPFQDYNISTASSVPGSLSHVQDEVSSDGTMSEWDHATDGVATPASWSEVGSVVSSDDGHHQ
ncbi:uncharacterized protein TRUGW13939_09525 [Talaromyces rugulosus]|uniref:Uncharacterized protein n=1 Tax=Talaromyces rugulosus TaxID=121627 RepID=A0A7H8R803_TALRU|nr:uncharacterized protein TRUGW13939_09525 [Talaromyces rugulosus]QKX62366.1 hypothetical protein TRUGW13939_09525 [Talaromyces rugulosus]